MKLQDCYEKYRNYGDIAVDQYYIPVYERYIEKRIDVCLLCIGVYKGYSLMMWQEFFNGDSLMHNAFILGIDNTVDNLRCPVNVYLGDIADSEVRKSIITPVFGKHWDYVIDNGHHSLENQIAAFGELFPYLADHAVYFIKNIPWDGIEKLTAAIPNGTLYDFRENSGRWDDILYVVRK